MGQKDCQIENVPRRAIYHNVQNTNRSNANKSDTPNKSLKCLFTNPNILDNKMSELISYVKEYKPLIIGIAEVKPKHCRYLPNPTTYKIQGYKMYLRNIDKKNGRGIILHIYECLNPCKIYVFEKYEECVCVEVNLVNKDKLLVRVVYRSDSGSDENNLQLLTMMKEVSHMKYSHKLITGDFNYRHSNWADWSTPNNEHHLEFTFLESIRGTFLHQHVTEPTRGRIGQNAYTLDLIFTNEEGMLSNLEHLSPLGKSDHCILLFDFNCYFVFNTKQKVYRFYDKGDYINMEKDLDLDWEVKFESIRGDVNVQWNEFSKTLKEAEDKWVHQCWQRFLETKEGEKWDKYCRQRNQVWNITRKIVRSTDTKLYNKISSQADQEQLQEDLDALHRWSKIWLLNFHPDFQVLYVCMLRNDNKEYYYKFKCGNNVHVLENVEKIKDFGVTVDSNISFETHINETFSKANPMAGLIRRHVLYLDEDMFNSLYKSQVHPHLEYANSVWHPHKQKHICSLENVQ